MENLEDPMQLQVVTLGEQNDAIFYLDPTLKELNFLKNDVMLSDTAISSENNVGENPVPKISLNIPTEFSDHSGDEDAVLKYYEAEAQAAIAKETMKEKKKSYKESRQRYRDKMKTINQVNDKFIKSLKTQVPGLTQNTDRAATLELTAKYIKFLQEKLGSNQAEGFLAAMRK